MNRKSAEFSTAYALATLWEELQKVTPGKDARLGVTATERGLVFRFEWIEGGKLRSFEQSVALNNIIGRGVTLQEMLRTLVAHSGYR